MEMTELWCTILSIVVTIAGWFIKRLVGKIDKLEETTSAQETQIKVAETNVAALKEDIDGIRDYLIDKSRGDSGRFMSRDLGPGGTGS